MAEEHHIDNFDPASFFSMHDFNSDGIWTPDEVRRLYGLEDESTKNTAKEVKDNAVDQVFAIFDLERTGQITRNE
jgi:Ca2+-binding EF-hand superfamily protein